MKPAYRYVVYIGNLIKKQYPRKALAAVLFLSAVPLQAADVGAKDVQVAARSIAFLENAPKGDTPTAIIFSAGNATSKTEAEQIKTLLEKNSKAGKATLKPVLVSSDALDNLANVKVAFLTSDLAASGAAAFEAAAAKGIPTISIGKACVDAGNCVVGVISSPKVQIFVNAAAAAKASASFSSAFRMMIKEI
jgi:hypothetical protein